MCGGDDGFSQSKGLRHRQAKAFAACGTDENIGAIVERINAACVQVLVYKHNTGMLRMRSY